MTIRFDRAIDPHEDPSWDRGDWTAKCREALSEVTSMARAYGWELVATGEEDVTVESFEFGGDPAIAIYDHWYPQVQPDQAIVSFMPHTSLEYVEGQMTRAMDAVEGFLLLRLREQRLELTRRELRLLDVHFDRGVLLSDEGDERALELIHVRQSRQLSSVRALSDLAELIESHDSRERDFQEFFEAWPEFLSPLQVLDARPQVVLESERNSIPDFAIQTAGESFYDLLELKRPGEPLLIAGAGRAQLTRAAARGLTQLRHYREVLEDPRVRDRILDRYGIELFKPRLHLVIGRDRDDDVRNLRRALAHELGPGEHVTTYDDLIRVARARLGLA